MSMSIDLDGERAIVTGANGGIGSAVIHTLVEAGAGCVFGLDVASRPADADNLDREKYFYERVDITDAQAVAGCFERIGATHGTPGILVNCAGITADSLLVNAKRPTESMTAEQFRHVLEVNLVGTFNCLQQAARIMTEDDVPGRIINISSISSAGNLGQANYSASKAGVLALTVSAAAELGRYGIRVNAISPGPVNTSMLDTVPDAIREAYVKRTPLRREAAATNIADAVLYLASSLSSHVTGENLVVSGGLRF